MCTTWPHPIDDSIPRNCAERLCSAPSDARDCKLHWRSLSSTYIWAIECRWPPLNECKGLCFSLTSPTVLARESDRLTDPVDSGEKSVARLCDPDKQQRAPKLSHKHLAQPTCHLAVLDAGEKAPSHSMR